MQQEQLLTVAPIPVGAYEAGIIRGGVGYVSGQFPLSNGKLIFEGRVGTELTMDQAQEAAELTARNVLAQVHGLTNGLKSLGGLLRLDGFVASAPDFLGNRQCLMRRRNISSFT